MHDQISCYRIVVYIIYSLKTENSECQVVGWIGTVRRTVMLVTVCLSWMIGFHV